MPNQWPTSYHFLPALHYFFFFFFASEATAITSGLSLVFNAVALNTLLYTEELLNTAICINYDHNKLAIGTCSITKITATAKPSKTKQQAGQAKFRQRKPDKDQSWALASLVPHWAILLKWLIWSCPASSAVGHTSLSLSPRESCCVRPAATGQWGTWGR